MVRLSITPRVGIIAGVCTACPLLAAANGIQLPMFVAHDPGSAIGIITQLAPYIIGPLVGYVATLGFRGASAWMNAGADEEEKQALDDLANADPKDKNAVENARTRLLHARQLRAVAGVLQDVKVPLGSQLAKPDQTAKPILVAGVVPAPDANDAKPGVK